MFDAMVSRLLGAPLVAPDRHRTGRKWRRHETAAFAAMVSGGVWALIIAIATIIW